jgi:hypothetical protein
LRIANFWPCLVLGMTLNAQVKAVKPAPVPAPIIHAKTVFISNSGSECNPFGWEPLTGGADKPYDKFYDAVKNWGRYEVVSAPGEADLVFEIHFSCPPFFEEKTTRADPQLRLMILDPKTHILLWAFTEHMNAAWRKGNRDKNFDEALDKVVNSLKTLAAQTVTAESRKN